MLRALKGERTAEVALVLNGDSAAERAGDGGIRSRANLAVDGAEDGNANGVGGTVLDGDLWVSQLHEQSLCSLEPVEGAEVGVVLPDDLSPGAGLPLAMDLRKSVYATGGVMGVLMPSSCLMKSANPGKGLRAERADSSEGKDEVIGVLSCASLGLVVIVAILTLVEGNECP